MTATVDGVLEHNKQIRDNMLKYNIGKYSQWPFALKPAIGEYYDIDYNRQLSDLKDGKDLLSFTHDGKSTYSEEIKRKFFSLKEEEPYFVRPLTYGELNPWIEFQNGSYVQYIDEVFGKDDVMRHIDYVNNILSGQFIENALRQTEVGVIKDINVAVALQGIVTTNPNNMSGEDTTMGKISNRMYAQTLYNGAIFNSDRMKAKIHDGENYYQKAYLTPELVNQYGNNLANLYELSDIMKIGTNETHIREDLGADVHILDGYNGNVANLDLLQFRILNEQIKKAIELRGVDNSTLTSKIVGDIYGNTSFRDSKGNDVLLPIRVYTPVDGQGYVNISKKDSDWRYESLGFIDVDGDALESQVKGGRYYGVYSANVYNEKEDDKTIPGIDKLNEEGNQYNKYDVIDDDVTTLLSKTSRLFHQNKIDTLIARFHTDSSKYGFPEFTDTARSKFGNSHGRNLLRLDAVGNPNNDTNGYDNPYCRTWTYHHQYNQVKKLIRPFTRVVGSNEVAYKNRDIQAMNKKYRAYRSDNEKNAIFGYQSLADNTVLQSNGFVKITPKSGDEGNDVRKCMFSIENLAWKDVLDIEDNLSKEQRGPNGGRIMWFPPYDLDFQEGVNVEWNQNTFIGRGEKVYTYTNTERTGTLSFSLLIDHPAIINSVTKNSYEGMGEEKDPEADILRFFAGCELLQETDKITEKPNPIPPQEKPNSQQKEGKIVFKIYYPNNFTGIVTDKNWEYIYNNFERFVLSGTSENTAYNGELSRDYWWQYILVGNNTCVPTNPDDFRGYEMQTPSENGNGLTNNETEYTDIPLPTCKGNKCVVQPKLKEIQTINGFRNTCSSDGLSDDENEQYYYQVDEDLHQKLKHQTSYKDTTSYQLNASFTTVDEKSHHQEYEYTFAEVIMALLAYNKGKGTYGSLYDLYKGYVIDTLKVDNNRIQSLLDIFNNDKIKFTSISYGGSADNNDKTNSDILARRRGITGYEMLRRLFTKLQSLENLNEIVKQENTKTGGLTDAPAFSKGQKINRFCEFTINYLIPAEDLKDTAGDNGTVNKSGDTEEMSFIDYMTAIIDYSPAISAYASLVMGPYPDYDMPIDNGKLRKIFETHFNDLQDKNKDILKDKEFLKKEIDELIKFINRDALILAYAVSDDASKADFRDIYDIPCNQVIEPSSDNTGYDCLESSTGCTETGCGPLLPTRDANQDSLYLKHIFACFLGGGAKLDDYKPTSENDVYFEFTVPSSLDIYKTNENSDYETYSISMNKVLVEVILGHYLHDKYDTFAIMSKKPKTEYLVRLCELMYENDSTTTFDIIKGTGLYHDDGIIPKRSTINYQNAYFDLLNSIITDEEDEDGNEIPCVISLLNEEIRDEEDKERQKEQGQKIQQQRPETQENKAEKQKLSEIAMVYGRDENIPNIRYETEGDYFKNIEITDPLLYKNLKDKFKYFNPAYHSISPEGFNARLTFLQQCTRQGQTVEMGSDTNNSKNGYTKTAANLAFGRMPVCVIRIGDFINTKAIINNMTISYAASDGVVWDLNAEGAGVQPMYAKISLGITLLGGQSLGAPISRLQNAISFNYYANAEAYDNRADVAIYKSAEKEGGNGYIEYRRIWSPLSKEYEYKNGQLVETGRLVNNETDDFNRRHANDGTWHDLTDEQIDEKLNPETIGEPEFDENIVERSEELTNYVINYNRVKSVLAEYNADSYIIEMYCNKDCSSYSYNKRGDTGVTSEQVKIFSKKLNEAINEAVHTYKIINNL